MKRLLLCLSALLAYSALHGQPAPIPTRSSEDVQGVMAAGYWARWDDAQQDRIDRDIDAFRKADMTFRTGKVKKGTTVKVEQVSSAFVFGASAFNWDQLGTPEANARYRELFGTLFNRATVPFYWKDFEMNPGAPRYEESLIDGEKFWNKIAKPKLEPHWRRPATDPIVDWCTSHGVAAHGHPLVWGSRKWMMPRWLQYDGVPESERRALDSLEIMYFASKAAAVPAYKEMTAEEVAAILPVYLQNQKERALGRVRDLMTRYKGRIGSWDVVNESAVDFKRGVNRPGEAMCKSNYGPMFADYTFEAFQEAKKHDDDATLLNINDYDYTEGYLQQVKDLVARGAKIEVIGSQMHLFDPKQCADLAAGKDVAAKANPDKIREFFSMIGSAGIPTCLSEITITSAGEGEKGEMIQAIIARNLYRLWFSLEPMMGITWWNIVDDCGAAGEPVISGLFHRDMTPKTAYYALDQLINHEWRTNLELTPDRRGNIAWRGFKGTYRITWTDPKGKVHVVMVGGQTAPEQPETELAFDEDLVVLLSDLHVNPQWYQPDYLLRVVCDILDMDPLPRNVVALGDLAFMIGQADNYVLLKEILAPLEAAGIRVTMTMGNHDRRENFAAAFPEMAARSEMTDRYVYVVDTPKGDIILMDSLQQSEDPSKYIGAGALSDEEKAWLKDKLASYTDKPVLVAAHHPLEEVDIKKILLDAPTCCGYLYGHWHKWLDSWTYRSFRAPGTLRTLCIPSTGNNGDIGYVLLRFGESHAEARLHEYEFFFPRPVKEGDPKPAEWVRIEQDNKDAVCRFAYKKK